MRAVHLDAKGRGRALQHVWSTSSARVVAYMDVDLSTDLNALLPLVAPLMSGHSDVAIGTRLTRSARVARGPKRELISRGYNLLLRATLRARFSDAQCGFKAMRAECAEALLPHVLDTQLVLRHRAAGARRASRAADRTRCRSTGWTTRTAGSTSCHRARRPARHRPGRASAGAPASCRCVSCASRRAARRVRSRASRRRCPDRCCASARSGRSARSAYLLLFMLARPMGAQMANLIALLLTAVANTAANRRFTFGIRGPGTARHQLHGLLVFGLGLLLTSGSLLLLAQVVANPPRAVELAVLVVANLAATVLRFVLLREWVFSRARRRAGHILGLRSGMRGKSPAHSRKRPGSRCHRHRIADRWPR